MYCVGKAINGGEIHIFVKCMINVTAAYVQVHE